MLTNIKSEFFLRIIFSKISEGIKLKLIRYNKYFQNLININLMNYKIYSGRYIIYEDNGKVKEYSGYTDKPLFEGEYLNGKKHGKGREYDNFSNIIFEGEYLNGKKNGKGKEYYTNGQLLFEGEYLNGKRWNGKGYKMPNCFIYELKEGKGFV